jgi:hypothetical protein
LQTGSLAPYRTPSPLADLLDFPQDGRVTPADQQNFSAEFQCRHPANDLDRVRLAPGEIENDDIRRRRRESRQHKLGIRKFMRLVALGSQDMENHGPDPRVVIEDISYCGYHHCAPRHGANKNDDRSRMRFGSLRQATEPRIGRIDELYAWWLHSGRPCA